jgi:hypothetical protein
VAERVWNQRDDHKSDGEGGGNNLEPGERSLHFALQLQGFGVDLYRNGISAMPDDLTMGSFQSPERRVCEKKSDSLELSKLTLWMPIKVDTPWQKFQKTAGRSGDPISGKNFVCRMV